MSTHTKHRDASAEYHQHPCWNGALVKRVADGLIIAEEPALGRLACELQYDDGQRNCHGDITRTLVIICTCVIGL